RQRLPGYGEAVAARQDVAGTALQARPAGHRCPAAPTGVRLPPGGGKGTPERPARPPHPRAFYDRWGAEKDRRNGQPGPPAPTGVRLPPGGGKGTPERPARPPPHQLALPYRWGAEKERRLDRAARALRNRCPGFGDTPRCREDGLQPVVSSEITA